MATVPTNVQECLTFYRTHLAFWSDNAPTIGLEPAAVAELADLLESARQATDAAALARQAARGARLRRQEAMEALTARGSALIATVRAYAQSQGDVTVYARAALRPPKIPAPRPAPGTPFLPRWRLPGDGTLELSWRCRSPGRRGGVVYEIRRSDGERGPMRFLATSGRRRFVDRSLPPGASALVYAITAVRSDRRGLPAFFPIRLTPSPAAAPLPQKQRQAA